MASGKGLFGEVVGVEGEGEPEADGGVGNCDAGEDEDAEAGESDECGVEAGAGGLEGAAGEGLKCECKGKDSKARGMRAAKVWTPKRRKLAAMDQ